MKGLDLESVCFRVWKIKANSMIMVILPTDMLLRDTSLPFAALLR